jgi:hypothetical protein
METAYQPELWRDLYVMLGTSSTALLGFLFVATSLHLEEIVKNPPFQRRARSNSYNLIFTLVEAAIVLTPQPPAVLAGARTLVNLAMLWLPIRNSYLFLYKNRETGRHGGWILSRAVVFLVASILGVAGGALLFWLPYWGLYLFTAGHVLMLVTVALNS